MLISRSPTSTRDANLFGDSSGVRWLRPCRALGGLPQEYGSRDLLCNPELPCRSRFFQLRMDAFWHRKKFCSMTPWLRSLWISCCPGFFESHAAFTFFQQLCLWVLLTEVHPLSSRFGLPNSGELFMTWCQLIPLLNGCQWVGNSTGSSSLSLHLPSCSHGPADDSATFWFS